MVALLPVGWLTSSVFFDLFPPGACGGLEALGVDTARTWYMGDSTLEKTNCKEQISHSEGTPASNKGSGQTSL